MKIVLETIQQAGSRIEEAWKLVKKCADFKNHFLNGSPKPNVYYKQRNTGSGKIELSCSHPDQYGNKFDETKIEISGADIATIFDRDKGLCERFLLHYATLLRERHFHHQQNFSTIKESCIQQIQKMEVVS